jgi:hypothetical protein
MLYAYFGHHKCASTWIDNIIREVALEHGYNYRGIVDHQTPTGHGPLTDYTHTFGRDELGGYVQREGIDFIGALTSDWSQVEGLSSFRAFHVIRDPRDIIVSGYFSHKNSHPVDHLPHMEAHRKRLQSMPKEEGLLLEMDYAASEMDDLATWNYDHPSVLELKMEDLTARPYEGFVEVFEFLGLLDDDAGSYGLGQRMRMFGRVLGNRLSRKHKLFARLRQPSPVSGEMLLGRVYDHRFEKKAGGREKGAADAQSHYRKGKAGDWANHFTPTHVAAFKEKFGDLVSTLGYEPSTEWDQSRIRSHPELTD